MINTTEIGIIREQLITWMKMLNHIKQEYEDYLKHQKSCEFNEEFYINMNQICVCIEINIDLHIEKIETYEREKSRKLAYLSIGEINSSHI